MYQIENIDYDMAIHEFRRRHYKAVIFFLYEDNEETLEYPHDLARRFDEINNTTNREIAFITRYANFKHRTKNRIPDEKLGRIKNNRLNDQEGIQNVLNLSNPDISMRTIAKAFKCGIENRLPRFVILDPREPEFFVEKEVSENRSVFKQVFDIIGELYDVECDIHRYAEREEKLHKANYYCLTSSELLQRNFNFIKYGIDVQNLKNAIIEDGIDACFNYDEIDNLTENGYIKLENFYENYNKIKIKDLKPNSASDNSMLYTLIDEGINFLPTGTEMLFASVSEFIEKSSVDYLRIAKRFYDGDLSKFGTSSSMVAICLGKLVEDELNLGIFNIFRGAFKVKLRAFYNRVQRDLGKLSRKFENEQGDFIIYFNLEETPRSCKLKYPKTSFVRSVAFDTSYSISSTDWHYQDNSIVDNVRFEIDIKNTKESNGSYDRVKLLDALSVIADTRNNAIHRAEPLKKEELIRCMDKFQYLIDTRFFKVNKELKFIECN